MNADTLARKYKSLDYRATLIRLLHAKEWDLERKMKFLQRLDGRVESALYKEKQDTPTTKTSFWEKLRYYCG